MKKLLFALLLCCALLSLGVASADIGRPVLTGPEKVLTNEMFTMTATMPGATKFRWSFHSEIEAGWGIDRDADSDGKSTWKDMCYSATNVRVAVKAYKDGKWSELSDVLQFKAESPYGKLEAPEMDPLPDMIYAGQDLKVGAKRAENAEESIIRLERSERISEDYFEWKKIWEDSIDDSGVTIIPGDKFEEGEEYQIVVTHTAVGYDYEQIYVPIYNVLKAPAVPTLTGDKRISAPKARIDVLTANGCELVFSASGARAWAVYRFNVWDESWEYLSWMTDLPVSVEFDESPTLSEEDLQAGHMGRELRIEHPAYSSEDVEYYCVRAYLSTGWTGPSSVVAVHTVAPHGDLGKPKLELVGRMEAGKPLTVEYSVPPHTEEYAFWVRQDGKYLLILSFDVDGSAGESGTFTFPEKGEANGHVNPETGEWEYDEVDLITGPKGTEYKLTLVAYAEGYNFAEVSKVYAIGDGIPVNFDLVLPNELTEIGESAFEGDDSIYSVKCPAGLARIGARAFADCENLEMIWVPEGAQIDETAFEGCGGVEIQRY